MKRLKIYISLLLILSFLMSAMPTLAADAGEITTESIVEEPLISEETTVTESTPEVEATILREEESLRGKHEKHFLMSDGTYQAVVYNEPIHYETATGWVEVDNTLTLQTAADGTAQYTTADGVTDVTFSRSFDEQLVTMRQGNYSLAWGVQAVSNAVTPILSTAEAELVTADLNTFTAEEQKTMAAKSSSTIQYRNALAQDVDLEYIVLPSRVKENIILNSAQNIAGYVVTVYTENITARLLENREIEFVNADNEVIFTMTSPYMYDSAGELSEDIEVELIDRGDVCYIFMTPNANWLNDASRVYPITIDPQVTTSSDAQNIIDNYVMENSGVQTYTLDRLYIGKKNGNRTRSYIKFTNMPTIPTGSTITATQMTLWLTTGQSTGSNAAAYIVNGGDWSSKTISWANMPSASGPVSVDISHNNLTKYVFPCNYAVQTWYTGSTTGQNKNYGIMVRYYDESINDYNPVYSADYTTASKRPSLTITYQVPSNTVSVQEGATYTLSSSGISGTITWASNNTTVATVNSSGKVTGVKAGKATITASVGGVVQKSFVIYVRIANGVYSIMSMSTGFYLGTYGSISENTTTRLLAKSSAGLMQVQQLWKITYLESGYYSIRPLHKLDMGLTATSNTAVISTIGTADTMASIPLIDRWTIQYNTTGYQFLHTGTISQALRPADGTSSPGLRVITAVGQSSNTFRWTISKLSSPPSGAYLYDTSTGGVVNSPKKYVVAGESKSLSDYNLLPIAYYYNPYSNEQKFSWTVSSSGSNYVTVNSSTGQVTGILPSTNAVAITGTCHGQTVQYSVQVLPIADGTYRLRNRASEKYAALWQNNSNNLTCVQWELATSNTQKWIITHLGDAVYSIRSADSATPYYMGVSGDSGANNQAVIPRSGTLTNGMKWKIESATDGFYKIIPLTGVSNNLVLAAETNSNGAGSNGDTLQQRSYVAGVHEWYLCRDKDYALLYLGAYEGHEAMTPLLESVSNALVTNAQMNGFGSTTMTAQDVQDHLLSSRIFSCVTHGLDSLIATTDGYYSIDDLNALPNSALDNVELVCLTACLTGAGENDANNFVNALSSKGANTVIGFTVKIRADAATYWTKQFMIRLSEGNTIQAAMNYADTADISSANISPTNWDTVQSHNRYVVGPTSVVPCQ